MVGLEERAVEDGPLLGPETVTWRTNREPAVLLGGGRALLLQVAHPLVAAGVGQHSNYETDPWGRLYRTLDTTYKIVFGDPETSRRASRRLIHRHDTVKGVSDDGVDYDAQDPALLVWVWATLVDTSLIVYERCFSALTDRDRERFYGEQKLFAYGCGVPEGACPADWAGFRDYWERMLAEELRVTPVARAVAHSVVHPQVPRLLRPALAPSTLITAGLLPAGLRAEYGFEWSPRRERLLALAFSVAAAGRIVPRRLRELPASWVATGRLDRVVNAARRRRLLRRAER